AAATAAARATPAAAATAAATTRAATARSAAATARTAATGSARSATATTAVTPAATTTAIATATRAAAAGRRLLRSLDLGQVLLEARGHDLALVDPHLHADAAEGRAGLEEAVVDVGAEGVQRHTTVRVALGTRHLRAAEAAGHLDADALGA